MRRHGRTYYEVGLAVRNGMAEGGSGQACNHVPAEGRRVERYREGLAGYVGPSRSR
jgi:hypothetical protein